MNLKLQSPSLLRALDIWQELWRNAVARLAEDDRKWLGVAHNIPDLAALTKLNIQVAIGPEAASSKYLQRIPSSGTKEIHEFMREFVIKL
jgi:hypothetical protein